MENQDFYNLSLGIAAGYATKLALGKALSVPRCSITKKYMLKVSQLNSLYAKPAMDAFEKSGLKEQGVSFLHMDENNMQEVLKKAFVKKNNKKTKKINDYNPIKRYFLKRRAKRFNKDMRHIAEGHNAAHVMKTSSILLNTEKLSIAAFHEMGHALNRNKPFRQFLVKSQAHLLKYFPPIILAFGLAKNKKDKSEVSNNVFDKTTNFIKNNAGILTSLCFVPTMTEEAIASINAFKIAKGVLNKPALKKLCKYNAFCWSTYLTGAVFAGLTTAGAIYVRDKIVHSKKV